MTTSWLQRFAWVCLMACSSAPAAPPVSASPVSEFPASASPVYAADVVLRAVGEREKAWTQPRTTLALVAGQAPDCSTYSKLKASGLVDEGHNMLVKSEYQICDVLAQLDKSVKLEALPAANYGAELASRLDLRTFRSSLRPRMDEDDDTLSSLFGSEVSVEPDAAVVESEDRHFSLTVVVVGDLDQSGGTDWLVWVSDEILTGTLRSFQTLLIRDVAPEGLLRAESL